MAFTTESGFNTTLSQKLDAGGSDTTIKLAALPITVTAGVMLVGSGTNKEWIYFSGTNAGNVQITGCQRGLDKDATSTTDTTSGNILSHRVGDPVRLVQHSLAQNNKPDLDESNTFTGAKQTMKDLLVDETIEFTDANVTIRRDTNDLKLKDVNQSEVTLSQLASLSGVNDKVKISNNDTTEGYLNGKMVDGGGTDIEEVGDGGNETLKVNVDTTDTTTFVKTSSGAGDEDKVPVLDSSGQLADGFINKTTAAQGGVTTSSTLTATGTDTGTVVENIDIDVTPFSSTDNVIVYFTVTMAMSSSNYTGDENNRGIVNGTMFMGGGVNSWFQTSTSSGTTSAISNAFTADGTNATNEATDNNATDSTDTWAISISPDAESNSVTVASPVWSSNNLRFVATMTKNIATASDIVSATVKVSALAVKIN
jgi:hypothetical protein